MVAGTGSAILGHMEKTLNINPHTVFNANTTLTELRIKGAKAIGDIHMMDLLSMLRNTCLEIAKDSLEDSLDESCGTDYAIVAERIHDAMETLALVELRFLEQSDKAE